MRTFLLTVGALAIAIALVGCGGDDGETSASGTTTAQSETTDTGADAAADDAAPEPDETATEDSREDDGPADDDAADEDAPDEDAGTPAPEEDDPSVDDEEPSSSDASGDDEKAAGAAVVAFFKALSAGDGGEACSLMAERVRRELEKGLARSPQFKGKGCTELISTLSKNYTDEMRTQLADVQLIKTRAKGETMLVTYKGASTPKTTIPVVNDGGAWRIGAATGTP